jgi:hypothetical protein
MSRAEIINLVWSAALAAALLLPILTAPVMQ